MTFFLESCDNESHDVINDYDIASIGVTSESEAQFCFCQLKKEEFFFFFEIFAKMRKHCSNVKFFSKGVPVRTICSKEEKLS